MAWTPLHVEWTRRAERDLRGLRRDEVGRIIDAVVRYADTGDGDVKALQGRHDGTLRLRVGERRVLFELIVDAHGMLVLRVLARGLAYR